MLCDESAGVCVETNAWCCDAVYLMRGETKQSETMFLNAHTVLVIVAITGE